MRPAATSRDPVLHEVAGLKLRVSVRGNGPPLLLLNGIGASLELFDRFRSALHGVQTVAFDAPGAGGSDTPKRPWRLRKVAGLVATLVERLGYGRVDVLGVSWGGALAQELALRHPGRVRRLVLAATSPGWLSVPGRPAALWILATPRRYWSPSYMADVAPTLYGGAIRDDPGLLREQSYHRLLTAPSLRGYLFQLAAIAGWASLPRLHRLTQPTLLLAGDDDPIIPLANAKLLAWRIPNARLRVVRGGGHLFLITRPDEIAPIVERFLTE